MKKDRRGSWYLLTGVVLGVVLGLVYSWEISPVKYVDAPPSALRADYKDSYRLLVALAFASNHDLLRAEARLAKLNDDQVSQSLSMQAERTMSEGGSQADVQALRDLLGALGSGVTPAVINTRPPTSPEGTPSPGSIDTLGATISLTATLPVSIPSDLLPSPSATP